MVTQHLYVNANGIATTITCLRCGKTKEIDVTHMKNVHLPRKVHCSCNATFRIVFERRRYSRKGVQLFGKYWNSHSSESDAVVIRDISHSGIGFHVPSKYLKDVDVIEGMRPGDCLHVEFRLQGPSNPTISGSIIIRNVKKGGYFGGEFYAQDDSAEKRVGFYLLSQ